MITWDHDNDDKWLIIGYTTTGGDGDLFVKKTGDSMSGDLSIAAGLSVTGDVAIGAGCTTSFVVDSKSTFNCDTELGNVTVGGNLFLDDANIGGSADIDATLNGTINGDLEFTGDNTLSGSVLLDGASIGGSADIDATLNGSIDGKLVLTSRVTTPSLVVL